MKICSKRNPASRSTSSRNVALKSTYSAVISREAFEVEERVAETGSRRPNSEDPSSGRVAESSDPLRQTSHRHVLDEERIDVALRVLPPRAALGLELDLAEGPANAIRNAEGDALFRVESAEPLRLVDLVVAEDDASRRPGGEVATHTQVRHGYRKAPRGRDARDTGRAGELSRVAAGLVEEAIPERRLVLRRLGPVRRPADLEPFEEIEPVVPVQLEQLQLAILVEGARAAEARKPERTALRGLRQLDPERPLRTREPAAERRNAGPARSADRTGRPPASVASASGV